MKQLLLYGLLFLALPHIAFAMPAVTITMALPYADTAYLVRVLSLEKSNVTFSVTETLRGNPVKTLSLVLGDIDLKPNDELLICSSKASRSGQRGNMVGNEIDGVFGWNYTTVTREENEVYVEDAQLENGHWTSDKIINGKNYLTLEHIKRFMEQRPQKP